MAFVTSNTQHDLRVGARAAGLFGVLRESIRAWRVYNKTVRELSELSARDLADLGLTEDSIHEAARKAAFGTSVR